MASAKKDIAHTAFVLFSNQGYSSTSYSAIADKSGHGRPLVQYHYPRKEDLAVEMVEGLLLAIERQFEGNPVDTNTQILHMGQVYYHALLDTTGMRAFTMDILADRHITSRIVSLNASWSLPILEAGDVTQEETWASIQATGGSYDLLFMGLRDGRALDAEEIAIRNLAAFSTLSLERRYSEELRRLRELLMPRDQAAGCAARALRDAITNA